MTRPHESPECRCEGCAAWDAPHWVMPDWYINPREPDRDPPPGSYSNMAFASRSAAECFADMIAAIEKMRDVPLVRLKPCDDIGPVPPWLAEKLREDS